MPRYYCDYCDTYLTHDSPSVRKQHNAGYKHKANVRSYYQQFEEQQTQSLIDQRIKEHLGQTAAFQQVGAAYNQHLFFPRKSSKASSSCSSDTWNAGCRECAFTHEFTTCPRDEASCSAKTSSWSTRLYACSRHAIYDGSTRCSFHAYAPIK